MFIEIHEFKASIKTLTDTDLAELIDILDIPRSKYKEDKNHKTQNLYALSYGFGTSGQSVYLRLGEYNDQHLIDQTSRQLTSKHGFYGSGAGYVRYRPYVYLHLHGSFFDNSPDFSLSRLIRFLDRIGYTPQNLDVAYNDDQGVTTLKDWLRVFGAYRSHCVGNILLKGKISILETSGEFERVQIGSASSPTAYGTLYRRPEFIRLEIKYRAADDIRELLADYSDDDRQAFNKAALDELVTNLDIFTAKSRMTKDPTKYKREKFWKNFLGSEPTRISKSALKKAMLANRIESDAEKYERGLKRIAGSLTNFAREFADLKTVEGIKNDLNRLLPGGFEFSSPLS